MTTEPADAAEKRRVLVVDDDARVRHALRALLTSSHGLAVAGEAASAPDALRVDEQLLPDIVLLDLLLPTAQEGLEVLRRLVGRGRTVVALTIRVQLRQAALDAGAAAFVEKGVSPDLLLEVLRSAH
ncbi:MAG TPA: response regulator [Acidimicrobiales bacterium]|nr:response regulator [Acidimicrobiales bacterium]